MRSCWVSLWSLCSPSMRNEEEASGQDGGTLRSNDAGSLRHCVEDRFPGEYQATEFTETY